jgi:cyclohexyl-isocyanide hydratase
VTGLHRPACTRRRQTSEGKRAITHWASHDLLESLGAVSVRARVVRGKLMIGGGVTAGNDFALTLIAELPAKRSPRRSRSILEFVPAPPFNAGSPETAPAVAAQTVCKRMTPILEERRRLAQAAATGSGSMT